MPPEIRWCSSLLTKPTAHTKAGEIGLVFRTPAMPLKLTDITTTTTKRKYSRVMPTEHELKKKKTKQNDKKALAVVTTRIATRREND